MTKPILLPRPKNMTWAEVYNVLAKHDDLHAQTQRADSKYTENRARLAFERVALRPGESVADIGCGDGRLIARLAGTAAKAVGTVLTTGERDKLVEAYAEQQVDFRVGRIEELHFGDLKFDAVILCAVINHMASKKEVRRALTIVTSLLKPMGRVYISDLQEDSWIPKRHRSTIRAFHWVWRTSGFKTMMGFAAHLWKRRHRAGSYEVPRLPNFSMSPEDFVLLAHECGLDLVEKWHASRPKSDGEMHARNDFMFRRA
jgi:2-polyprenyl-3-methyl-5-hydroxy-6-metoxy-1,4-benzoquinol methylase